MSPTLLRWSDYLSSSTSLQMFTMSTGILLLSIAALVWVRAVRWSFLDDVRLDRVEFTHPHLPSPNHVLVQVVAFLAACASLLATELPLITPYEGIRLLGPALLVIAVAVAAELISLKTRIYGISLSLGMMFGIGVASLLNIDSPLTAATTLFLLGTACIVTVIQMRNRKLVREWPRGAHVLLLFSTVGWILFLQTF